MQVAVHEIHKVKDNLCWQTPLEVTSVNPLLKCNNYRSCFIYRIIKIYECMSNVTKPSSASHNCWNSVAHAAD